MSSPLFSCPHSNASPRRKPAVNTGTTLGTTDLKDQQRQKFEGVFENLRDELVDHLKRENMPIEAVEWYRRVGPPFLREVIIG